jgi:hypothetical protein
VASSNNWSVAQLLHNLLNIAQLVLKYKKRMIGSSGGLNGLWISNSSSCMQQTPQIPFFSFANLHNPSFSLLCMSCRGHCLQRCTPPPSFILCPPNCCFGLLVDVLKENLSYEPKDSYFSLNHTIYLAKSNPSSSYLLCICNCCVLPCTQSFHFIPIGKQHTSTSWRLQKARGGLQRVVTLLGLSLKT